MRPIAVLTLATALAACSTAVATPNVDGPDIRIRDGTIIATAADYEMDGTMWVAFTVLEDSNNYLYRSDHGLSWDYRAALRPGSGIAAVTLRAGAPPPARVRPIDSPRPPRTA